MQNYFQASPKIPFHISIGAVPIDQNRRVYCHYWNKKHGIENLYSLMKETIEPNETIEQALKRGLLEEFGMEGKIQHYIGSIIANDEWFGEIQKPAIVEKTTLYFLVNVETIDTSKRLKSDKENDSEVVSLEIDELTDKMDDSAKRSHLNYFGESKILNSVKLIYEA